MKSLKSLKLQQKKTCARCFKTDVQKGDALQPAASAARLAEEDF